MSLINSISNTYKGTPEFYAEVSKDMDDATKAVELEGVLTNIANELAYIDYLTDNKNVDVELLLQIVGAYLISTQEGELEEDTPPPSVLFEESLFPALRNHSIDVEVIKEGEDNGEKPDDSGSDTGTIEEVES